MARTLRQINSKLRNIRKRIPKLSKNDKERFGLEMDRDMLKLEKRLSKLIAAELRLKEIRLRRKK
jgi:hypothetical protein|tara:strand:- start:281 stop:475 length:195 start_codon:yes stop_codon:yes gene_type:complete